jgi:flagellar biosynthesis protein FlhA
MDAQPSYRPGARDLERKRRAKNRGTQLAKVFRAAPDHRPPSHAPKDTPNPLANTTTDRLLGTASRFSHLTVPLGAVVILLVLLVPLPPSLLDVLISFNLMLSVVVLLVSVYITQPVKFTSFPNLLLLTTLYRLALNVATSRLILSHGESGENAAGAVIKAFGEFVIGGNFVVGVVMLYAERVAALVAG